jgi:CelD/BcsL family acetyltransferase involved in cellulose biosynthesis
MKIFLKEDADQLFKDEKFLNSWDQLKEICPWSTVFQGKDFVLTWYSFYKEYIPIVLTDWNGKYLTGIFTLTLDKKGNITAAGTNQAEYQVWLSSTADSDEILEKSIDLLKKHFPESTLSLKYLPPKTPIQQFQSGTKWKQHLYIKSYTQPLMASNETLLTSELKKKNKKEKINRLRRKGNLKFEIIGHLEDFIVIVDKLILQSDFRKGAMYDKLAFQQESQRKDFLIKLFELGLLHVSILKLDEEIIASNAGIIGFEMVHLQGINSHSPFYSKYSPGILHFLMLGIELKNTGKKYFDLTPGGAKGYKEMLATTFQEAYELKVYSKMGNFIATKREALKNKIKNHLEEFPEYQNKISSMAHYIQAIRKKSSLFFKKGTNIFNFEGLNKVFSNHPKEFIQLDPVKWGNPSKDFGVQQNNLADLMIFDDSEEIISRWEFLYDCMKRIEMGHHFYSLISENSLRAVLWYIPKQVKSGELSSSDKKKFEHPTLTFSYYQPAHLSEAINFMCSILGLIKDAEPIQLQFSSKQKSLKRYLNQKL